MNYKYLLLLGALLFAGLGEAMDAAAAALSPTVTAPVTAIGPYAKRKALKPQHKRKKSGVRHGRPLVRAIY